MGKKNKKKANNQDERNKQKIFQLTEITILENNKTLLFLKAKQLNLKFKTKKFQPKKTKQSQKKFRRKKLKRKKIRKLKRKRNQAKQEKEQKKLFPNLKR